MAKRIWINGGMSSKTVTIFSTLAAILVALAGLMFLPRAALASTSQELFARHGEKVLQVRILDRNTGLKAGFGSGFVLSGQGRVATNYHVVADLVMNPEDYRAEYHHEDGSRGELKLIAVDVVNDLALLQAEDLERTPLPLSRRQLKQGEPVFALGNPYDLGLTIVEGTYNGFQEKSLYERIHYTGSINPGMSGGPALDSAGEVIGINVATAGNQVSFLVPVAKLKALLAAPELEDGSEEQLAEIRRQLFENQQRYFDELLTSPFQRVVLGDYTLPGELADYVHCWGHSPKHDEQLFDMSFQGCGTQDEIYLSEELSIGAISFRHELYRADELESLRFYNLLERKAQHAKFSFGGDEEDLTRFACSTQLVDKGPVSMKMLLCLRSYQRFEGLYDLFMSAYTVHSPVESLNTSLSLTGASYDNAKTFLSTYLDTLVLQESSDAR
jgi:hypothetical protein